MNREVLLWFDLETTGLDPNQDEILEVALIVTDWNLSEISKHNWVIYYDESKNNSLSEYVREMHTNNNLFKECKNSKIILEVVEDEILKILEPYGLSTYQKFVIGGNSVHFDQSFLNSKMSKLRPYLSHRVIDVTSIELMMPVWNKNIVFLRIKGDHRALGDIENSLFVARQAKSWIAKCDIPEYLLFK